jgi:hypothetical protein
MELKSIHDDYSITIHPLILNKVTGQIPHSPIRADWSHLRHLQLADPNFHQPGRVEILLGAQSAAAMRK